MLLSRSVHSVNIFDQGKRSSRWTETFLVVYIHYTIAVKHLTAFPLLSGKLEKPKCFVPSYSNVSLGLRKLPLEFDRQDASY